MTERALLLRFASCKIQLTEVLSVIRNLNSFKSLITHKLFFESGGHLLSHTVSSAVPSAAQVLTFVFGMGTGVSPERIATRYTRYQL